ncbi:ferredoxin [Jatrophihabitans sp.]|uniref:ferredoxin n=1 Tax=Jatrophihabitans sp. TaxID=1932789 RepID=UPI0030C6D4B5|nr:ferredoxin [Jatrophihabitans sp.]
MEVKVDFDLCEANAVCCGIAPDIFELDEDEYLVVKVASISDDLVERAQLAAARCPKNALQIVASSE